MKSSGFRVNVNDDDVNMRYKVKAFEFEKIPYMLIVGDKELLTNSFSLRSRKDGDLGAMSIIELCEYLKDDLEMGKPKYIFG